ncbi:DUF6538 domain-containing protein [Shewanella intestini]|uniref:DUF6538 domain-containing protein n=1 Tax=Shewanella intestini TaxID=2017544 RepID=A0ABS5I292_9GAMM|nr:MULTISPECIES: DUF6538 domain-containing protein [Shewanella]MBR9728138.1 hypothetical protein [Shewanella intestini]MRG36609.1 hypothetical protein [Shewanella sp. XMDDZSB0408]
MSWNNDYLQLRNNIFHFRYRIPYRFQQYLGQQETKKSLATNSYFEALSKVANKKLLIKRINAMKHPSPALSQLFAELTDYTAIDGLEAHERLPEGRWAPVFDVMDSELRDSLKNGGGRFTPSDYNIKTLPPSDSTELLDYENLALRLIQAMESRLRNGRCVEHDTLLCRARELLNTNTKEDKLYLLSVAWEDFVEWKTKSKSPWSKEILRSNKATYQLMLARWGQ